MHENSKIGELCVIPFNLGRSSNSRGVSRMMYACMLIELMIEWIVASIAKKFGFKVI